ncbi:MAG TPA: YncE family protein [Blastocatellia bacterium]|nr:YncE family protein [Blastocatellia bacterium]
MNKKIASFIFLPLFLLAVLTGPAYPRAQEGDKAAKDKAEARTPSKDQQKGQQAGKGEEAGRAKPASDVTSSGADQGKGSRRIVKQGVSVELSIEPAAGESDAASDLKESENTVLRLKITDTATNAPLTNLRPTAWVDRRRGSQGNGPEDCRNKIQSFLQGSLSTRPDIDLNTYYILTLNKEGSISVIDPLLSYGTSKLYTLVLLKSPGEDWVQTRDGKRLFVTMPMVNQVAVIDTTSWKVLANVDVGRKPTRIALQPDGRYVWVCNDGLSGEEKSGVTVIDSEQFKVVAQILTGAGHHEIAFTDNDLFAFVSNKQEGTLSVIDVRKLAKRKDVKVGLHPASLTFSSLSKAVYVANEGDGTVSVVDGGRHDVLARMTLGPGLNTIRFAPGGRMGFVTNPKKGVVYVFDSATNRMLQAAEIGHEPTQLSFTEGFAYVRSVGTEYVTMIELTGLNKDGSVNISTFPAGQRGAGRAFGLSTASAIVPAPEGNAVLVANPADKTIYYYTQGMAAPMGNFQNYRREPRAVLVSDRSLRETSPGVYSVNIKPTNAGTYDVPFLLDSPRVYHCFEMTVKPDPALAKRQPRPAFKVEPLLKEAKIKPGEVTRLQFKLSDPQTKEPKADVKDVGVLTLLASGTWNKRQWARPIGDGVYEVEFTAPEAGVYYVFWECPSLNMKYNQTRHIILDARDESTPPATGTQPAPAGGGKPSGQR